MKKVFLIGKFNAFFDRNCMHECVLTPPDPHTTGVHTSDIAKRLLDYGFYAPTIYFPLIVPEALMVEPTETENKDMLDAFVAAMELPVMTQTIYAIYILLWSFLGYYFSPFHLCQLLSIKYIGCETKSVYRQHVKMMPVLCVAGVVIFLVYHMMFL